MKKRRRQRGRLLKSNQTLTNPTSSFRVVGIVDGSDLKDYGIYPTIALAKEVAKARQYDESQMTCFVYTTDNRVVFSTEGKN